MVVPGVRMLTAIPRRLPRSGVRDAGGRENLRLSRPKRGHVPGREVSMSDSPAESSAIDCQSWLDRHGDYLYRYALRTVRRTEAAEDLVQETLLAAWRGRAAFGGRSSERSWLTAILKRKVIDWLRTTVRERARTAEPGPDELDDAAFTKSEKWKGTWKPVAWATDAPDSDTTRAEFWEVVRSCSGKLPPRLRDVFVLRHLEEAESEEICQAAGITPSNLWVMLHRARLRMWRCLTQNWYGTAPSESKAGDA